MYGLYQIVYFTIIDIINTLKSPFFIVIFLIIYYQYYKIGDLEKNILGRKNSPLVKTIVSTLFGIIGGIIATVSFIYLGVVVVPRDFMYILIIAILLSMINPRYMCFSYGGSIISLISIIFKYPVLEVSQIMVVVAVLHIVESILIILEGDRNRLPVYFEFDHEIVGGFNMNRFWPLPFVIFIGEGLIHPITLMAILSYGDFTVSSLPSKKTIKTGIILLLYSTILLLLIKIFPEQWIAPLFALVGHEFIILFNSYREKKKIHVFTSPLKGLRVLEATPKGLAYKIGIRPGDIIISINDIEIKDDKDIEDIESLNLKYFKIKFFNKKKGIIIKKYEGNRKTLGIVIVPRVLS